LLPSLLAALLVFKPTESFAEAAPCDTYQVNGGDQAFLMNLNTPLEWGGTVYTNNIYVSPKGTITFGQGDFTYWTYPATPSISIGSYDYHAFANGVIWGANNNLYVRYGSTATSICVDWKVMLWGQSTGQPIYIRMLAEVNPVNYTWTPTYQVSSNAPANARYGARYTQNGPIQPLSIQVITTPPPASPTPSPINSVTPSPSSTPTPSPTETTSPSPTPTETVTVSPTPTASPTPSPSETATETPSPTPSSTPTPTPTETQTQAPNPDPVQSQSPTSEPTVEPEPEPEPVITEEPVVEEPSSPEPPIDEPIVSEEELIQQQALEEFNPDYEYQLDEVVPIADVLDELSEEEVLEILEELDPNQPIEYVEGVIIEAGVALVFEQLDNPAALFAEALDNPGQVLEALGQLGADMTEEQREDSQQVVVASVIVSQVLGAMTLTTTPPPAPSAPSGGGGGGGGGGDSGGGKKKLKLKKKPKLKPRRRITRHRRIK